MLLERYVNDGSPSGFSFENTPAPGFRPFDEIPQFQLPIFGCDEVGAINVGTGSTLLMGELPVHPDMAKLFHGVASISPRRELSAVATSSGRTLSIFADGKTFFVKVAYQGLLGRVTRKMTKAHVLSAIEISASYEVAIREGRLPATFNIYREHSGLYFPDGSALHDWGYVERGSSPFPLQDLIEVPAFSLFANLGGRVPTLLSALLDRVHVLRSVDGFFAHFAKPLLDLYFSSVVSLGLQPEAHAQNVIFLLNQEYLPVGTALRDMESVDKDIPLLDALGLTHQFTPTGYKFLSKSAYNYQIMHSFMYDFKLGQYLLGPLVDAWAQYSINSGLEDLEERIRSYAQHHLTQLPEDFFPKAVWYDYEPVVHEGARPRHYREHLRPRFR